MVPPQLGEVERDLSRVAEGLASAFDELREISRGIHPLDLVRGGPGAGAEIAAPAFGGTRSSSTCTPSVGCQSESRSRRTTWCQKR